MKKSLQRKHSIMALSQKFKGKVTVKNLANKIGKISSLNFVYGKPICSNIIEHDILTGLIRATFSY